MVRTLRENGLSRQAEDLAQAAVTLAGWLNNAAVFRDASLHSASIRVVLDLIPLNLNPAVVGWRDRDPPSPGLRERWGDRQRLSSPSAPSRPGLPVVRDGQGRASKD